MSNNSKSNNHNKEKRSGSRKTDKENRPKRSKENKPVFNDTASCLKTNFLTSKSGEFSYCRTKRQYNMKRAHSSSKQPMLSLNDLEKLYDNSNDATATKRPLQSNQDMEIVSQRNEHTNILPDSSSPIAEPQKDTDLSYSTPRKQIRLYNPEDDVDDLPDIFSTSSNFLRKSRCKIYHSQEINVQETSQNNQQSNSTCLDSHTITVIPNCDIGKRSYSSDSNKTVEYKSINSLAFNPIPSTSKDNQTFIKNDELFNNTLKELSAIENNLQENSQKDDDDDIQIIEIPTETIVIDCDPDTNSNLRNHSNVNSCVRNDDDDDDCILIEDKTDKITVDSNTIEVTSNENLEIPSTGAIETYNILDDYADFDALIATNQKTLDKLRKSKTKHDSVCIHVDVTTREGNASNIGTQNSHHSVHENTRSRRNNENVTIHEENINNAHNSNGIQNFHNTTIDTTRTDSVIDVDVTTSEETVNNGCKTTPTKNSESTRSKKSKTLDMIKLLYEAGVQAINDTNTLRSISPSLVRNRVQTQISETNAYNRKPINLTNIQNVQDYIHNWEQQNRLNENNIPHVIDSPSPSIFLPQYASGIIDITENPPNTFRNEINTGLSTSSTNTTQTYCRIQDLNQNGNNISDRIETVTPQVVFIHRPSTSRNALCQTTNNIETQTSIHDIEHNVSGSVQNVGSNITHNWEHHNNRHVEVDLTDETNFPISTENRQQRIANEVRNFFESSRTPPVHSTDTNSSRRGRRRPGVKKSKKSTTPQQVPVQQETTPVLESQKSTGFSGECPICMEPLSGKEIASTICGHVFCMKCLETAIKNVKRCPTCRKILKKNGYHKIFL